MWHGTKRNPLLQAVLNCLERYKESCYQAIQMNLFFHSPLGPTNSHLSLLKSKPAPSPLPPQAPKTSKAQLSLQSSIGFSKEPHLNLHTLQASSEFLRTHPSLLWPHLSLSRPLPRPHPGGWTHGPSEVASLVLSSF